jgi:hypothetical protein
MPLKCEPQAQTKALDFTGLKHYLRVVACKANANQFDGVLPIYTEASFCQGKIGQREQSRMGDAPVQKQLLLLFS